jgi:predicted nucleic acid-binding protein
MAEPVTRYLLDSVILIDHFNGISAATQFLHEQHQTLSISVITRAEVLTGFAPDTVALARQFLELFPVLPIEARDADLAAQLRREHRWKLPDAFQAALALNHQLKLATRNTTDFPPDKYSFVVAPYTIP